MRNLASSFHLAKGDLLHPRCTRAAPALHLMWGGKGSLGKNRDCRRWAFRHDLLILEPDPVAGSLSHEP